VKGSVAILVCDGTPDSDGEVVRKDGVEVPDGEVPVTLEFGTDLGSVVGKAKLHWREDVLFADLELLATRMSENGLKVLYPRFAGILVERRDHVLYKCILRHVSLSVGHNADLRIGTLFNQGVR
jgi:hypothetical protein